MQRVSCTLRARVGVRTEMKKERNCLDVASNSTMEVLGLTWNKNCMEEVGYYCTGPYLIHSCDKVYLILTHKKRGLTHTIKPIQSMQVSAILTASWLETMGEWG